MNYIYRLSIYIYSVVYDISDYHIIYGLESIYTNRLSYTEYEDYKWLIPKYRLITSIYDNNIEYTVYNTLLTIYDNDQLSS